MNAPTLLHNLSRSQLEQRNDIRGLSVEERDKLIVFVATRQGVPVVESVYGDLVWWLVGSTTNTARSNCKLDFKKLPGAFIEVMKAIVYRYSRRGACRSHRPKAPTIARFFTNVKPFLAYLNGIGICSLSQVTPLVCSNYAQHARVSRRKLRTQKADDRVAMATKGAIAKKMRSVEYLYELSQYTDDPMPSPPWGRDESDRLSAEGGRDNGKTPLIPNEIFERLFQAAWSAVSTGMALLDLRDELDALKRSKPDLCPKYITALRSELLTRRGFNGTFKTLDIGLGRLRTACYIVIASLSGCRNHELCNIRRGSVYTTTDSEGNSYFWMRSKSTKTGAGHTEWMIPEAAASAIKLLERWALPFQRMMVAEMDALGGARPVEREISDPAEHLDALFIGLDHRNGNRVRTLSLQAINEALRRFAANAGLDWKLTSHQFRRKFANYAARSQFGDLRYLKEHFKHWSMDMTLGYALNDFQEMALYLDIQDELDDLKEGVVAGWLDDNEPLAGGYGEGLVEWRGKQESVVMFKTRSAMVRAIAASTPIRSNGHSWCTAGDNLCVGNDLERTRCGAGCDSAVIGRQHAPLYQALYDQLKELEALEDIGASGIARVGRDLARCSSVLSMLNGAPIGAAAA